MGTPTLTAHQAAALSDDIEASAFTDLFAAAPAGLKEQLGLRIRHVGYSTVLLAPRMPTAMFNRAMGLGMRRPAQMRDVREIMAIFHEAKSTTWWLHWNPHAAPTDFPAKLPALGFTQPPRKSWAKVLRGPTVPPSIRTDLRIETVTDASQAEQAAQAVTRSFEMPPFMAQWFRELHGRPRWRMYTVNEGSQVVGGGCLYIDGDTAWLGMGSVLPSHRRRGGQGALMTRRISDAIEAGCTHIATETGEAIAGEPNPSLANMRRCGFETVASRLNFAGP